jgi:hemoglobin
MQQKLKSIMTVIAIIVAGTTLTANVCAQEGVRLSEDAGIYKEFGEKAGLINIMDDFMINLLKDPRTRSFFENADQKHIKEQLVDQFCYILNGPCDYRGAKMKPIHANLGINRENFNALIEQLQFSMDKYNVPFRAQNKLLAVLAPMHREIIAR